MNLQKENTQPTVFVVDDDASIREAVKNLLASQGVASLVFASAEEFSSFWRPEQAGCLLLDVQLPGLTGVEFQEHLCAIGEKIPIIFMTAFGDIPMVRKVMKAGAIEFLTKPFDSAELLAAIHHGFALDAARRAGENASAELHARWVSLSPREREVMLRVVAGLQNKQAAAELGLSEVTIKMHRRHVMEKMQADTLADLVRMASLIQTD